MVLNATFANTSVISWWSFYWWRKPEYTEKPPTSRTLSHNVVYLALSGIRTHTIIGDRH